MLDAFHQTDRFFYNGEVSDKPTVMILSKLYIYFPLGEYVSRRMAVRCIIKQQIISINWFWISINMATRAEECISYMCLLDSMFKTWHIVSLIGHHQ